MRISDWSSDVCSSDLFAPHGTDAVGKWLSADQTKAHDQLIEIPLLSPDPDDLTLRTARLLGMADTVYHLADIPVVILDRARADAVRLTAVAPPVDPRPGLSLYLRRSEEHTSELQSLMRISSAVFRLKKKTSI